MTKHKPARHRETPQPPALAVGENPPQQADRLRPWLLAAMTALLVCRPLFPSESAAVQGDGMPVAMLWIVLAVCWLLGAIGQARTSVRFAWTDAAVLVLIGLHTVAGVWAAGHLARRPAVNMLWEWIGMGLLFFLARQFLVGRREIRAAIAAMLALAVALSAYGFYQTFYDMPHTRAQYKADPDGVLRAAGLWFARGSPERERFENRLANTEPNSTFALTNSLAGFLAPWLIVAGGSALAACGVRRRDLRGWATPAHLATKDETSSVVVGCHAHPERSGGWACPRKRGHGTHRLDFLCDLWPGSLACCAAPIAVCLALTKSRSGYIAAGIGLVLAWLSRGAGVPPAQKDAGETPAPQHRRWLAVATIGVLVLAFALVARDRALWDRAAKSFGYRLQYWQATLAMIADHPWLGCGPGNFQNGYTRYKLPEASEEVADPHNFIVEVWATAGTPAGVTLLAVLGTFAVCVWRNREDLPNDLPSDQPVEHPGFIVAGALAGFALAAFLWLSSMAAPGIAALWLGLPVATACLALLWKWIEHGPLSPLLPAIAAMGLCVHLSASGGIGFPGVAGSLWLLLAAGLNLTETGPARSLPRWATLGALVATIGLTIACYQTAYAPVLYCQSDLRQALREPLQAERHLRAAAADDPWDARPWFQLAGMAFQFWQQSPDEEWFARFEQYQQQGLDMEPNSAPAWVAAADKYFQASRRSGRQADLEKAIAAYQRAVALYPNNGVYHAYLARAYLAAGKRQRFDSEAHTALELDRITPHDDKKLRDLRDELLRNMKSRP